MKKIHYKNIQSKDMVNLGFLHPQTDDHFWHVVRCRFYLISLVCKRRDVFVPLALDT